MKKKSSPDDHVDLDNARFDDQREIMRKIIENNESPFLLKNLRKYHRQPILREGEYWYITLNQWPYKNTRFHFLIISQAYWTELEQITPEAAVEFMSFVQWLIDEYQLPGGAFCMRFGDSNYSAGTVSHLHAQLIVPEIQGENYQPTRFKIGKDAEKLELS